MKLSIGFMCVLFALAGCVSHRGVVSTAFVSDEDLRSRLEATYSLERILAFCTPENRVPEGTQLHVAFVRANREGFMYANNPEGVTIRWRAIVLKGKVEGVMTTAVRDGDLWLIGLDLGSVIKKHWFEMDRLLKEKRKMKKEAAEPGATDNPDDAQR